MGIYTDRGQIPCGMTCKNPSDCRKKKKCMKEEDDEREVQRTTSSSK
mgnify:FL=1